MKRLLIQIFLLPLVSLGQSTDTSVNSHLTKAYVQAITEYIKDIGRRDTFNFDTLFIGKHEEFPIIALPAAIENKKIVLLSYSKNDKGPQTNATFVLVNIIERKFTKDHTTFMLVTFHRGYRPQHNCYIDLGFNISMNEYQLREKIRYEYPYPKGN